MKKTIASLILSELANDRRIIAADWRLYLLYLRVARAHGFRLPDPSSASALIRRMESNDEIEEIGDVHGIYKVMVPYASSIPTPDEAIVQEANPTAVFNNFTAIAHHGLTNELPPAIYASHASRAPERYPLGTTPDDWSDVHAPPRRTPSKIGDREVIWSHLKPEWDFGHKVEYVSGVPIYVTDLERTLLDALRFPEKCGGILEVLRVWKRGLEDANLDRLIQYAEKIDQALLRQRAGFVIEMLGRRHDNLDEWAKKTHRGSSSKLVASEKFMPTFSERWSLSINVPESVLSALRE